jgi:hypothetical protein
VAVGRGVGRGIVTPEIKRKTRTWSQKEFLRLSPSRVAVSLGKRLFNLSICPPRVVVSLGKRLYNLSIFVRNPVPRPRPVLLKTFI